MVVYHFSRLFWDNANRTPLLRFDIYQGADDHCNYKSKYAQQGTYTEQGETLK